MRMFIGNPYECEFVEDSDELDEPRFENIDNVINLPAVFSIEVEDDDQEGSVVLEGSLYHDSDIDYVQDSDSFGTEMDESVSDINSESSVSSHETVDLEIVNDEELDPNYPEP